MKGIQVCTWRQEKTNKQNKIKPANKTENKMVDVSLNIITLSSNYLNIKTKFCSLD